MNCGDEKRKRNGENQQERYVHSRLTQVSMGQGAYHVLRRSLLTRIKLSEPLSIVSRCLAECGDKAERPANGFYAPGEV